MKIVKDDYFYAVKVDHIRKRFTATSRSESAHNRKQGSVNIDPVTGEASCHWGHWRNGIAHPLGNDWPVLGRNLSKKDARFSKEQTSRTLESLGYTYHPVFDEGDKE